MEPADRERIEATHEQLEAVIRIHERSHRDGGCEGRCITCDIHVRSLEALCALADALTLAQQERDEALRQIGGYKLQTLMATDELVSAEEALTACQQEREQRTQQVIAAEQRESSLRVELRSQQEQWRIAALNERQRAEQAKTALTACRAQGEAMREALALIHDDHCSHFTTGPGSCWREGRTPDAEDGADRCCDACIAFAALSSTPKEPAHGS